MKKNSNNRTFKVGFLVFSSLTILIITIYLIGSKDNLFASKITVYSAFQDIKGVVVGNNVRFSGINVGTVKSIEMNAENTVVLSLSIAEKYAKFIYKDCLVEIGQDGFVGNKLINISSGNISSGRIHDADTLVAKHGIDYENILSQAGEIIVSAKSTVESLNSILAKIDSGKGDIGRLLNEDNLTSELEIATKKLNSMLANIDGITQKINKGEGDIGKLINDNKLTDKANSILTSLEQTLVQTNQITSDLQTTTQQINDGNGVVSKLLNNKSTANSIDSTILKVQESLEQFDKTAIAIQESWLLRMFSKKKK